MLGGVVMNESKYKNAFWLLGANLLKPTDLISLDTCAQYNLLKRNTFYKCKTKFLSMRNKRFCWLKRHNYLRQEVIGRLLYPYSIGIYTRYHESGKLGEEVITTEVVDITSQRHPRSWENPQGWV